MKNKVDSINALETILAILDCVVRLNGKKNIVIRPERLDGVGEIQTLIYTAKPENGYPSQVYLICVEQISRTKTDFTKPDVKLETDQKFWGGYSKGIAEICTAFVQAIHKDRWTDVEGIYKENSLARHEIEEICRIIGQPERAEALRKEYDDDGADFLP